MNEQARLDRTPIPFIDVAAQRRRLGDAIDDAVARVLDHCQFILGPEVRALEQALAAFCGARHAVSCASGTDALALVLMAKGIGPGDAVICPSFTFCATAEMVVLLGATPVFADVDEATFNIVAGERRARDRDREEGRAHAAHDHAGRSVRAAGRASTRSTRSPRTRSCSCSTTPPRASARRSATASSARSTDATTTSFFPAKPLGCYGDGGAVFTDDPEMAETLVSLRVHGQGRDKYDNVRIGLTARLDTIQAAVLIEKLKIFPDEIDARNRIAKRYAKALAGVVGVPKVPDGMTSVWAQYTIRIKPGTRDAFAAALKAEGIPTAIYYPKPLHRMQVYGRFPWPTGGLPVTDRLAEEVISLPMHAYLDEPTQDRIVAAVRRAVAR